jgi:hypothetical protein
LQNAKNDLARRKAADREEFVVVTDPFRRRFQRKSGMGSAKNFFGQGVDSVVDSSSCGCLWTVSASRLL